MDDCRVELLESASLDLDEVLLSDRTFDTDPSKILIESSDPQKLRFRLIEWLARSPNRKVKAERKQAIAETLDISIRQVERMLNQYQEDRLCETAGIRRADKGRHRIDGYWQDYIRKFYEQSLKNKHPHKPADVVREVKRHAVIDLRHEDGDYPHPATVYRILKPLIERQMRRKKIRNPGAGSWLTVETRDGKLLKADFSNQIIQCDHTKLDIRIVDQEGKLLSWRLWLTTVVDTFSSCLVGYHLWHKQPGAHEVALALRHAALPKQYPPEYELEKPWDVCGLPLQYFFTDGGKDLSKAKLIKAMGKKLGFACELRDRPSEGGIEERSFGSINTDFLSGLYGYLGSNIQERPEGAEGRACFRLKEFHQLLVRYIVDNYNQRLDARMGDQSRIARWELGLEGTTPRIISERELDICLMRKTRRSVYRGGYLKFENILYRGEYLGGYEGKFVTLRYDPDDITTVWVYYREADKNEEAFLTRAHATGLEGEKLSLWEAKAASKRIRKAGRAVSNESVLAEVRDRIAATEEEKSKMARKKSEHNRLYGADKPAESSDVAKEESELVSIDTPSKEPQQPRYKVWDYDELLED